MDDNEAIEQAWYSVGQSLRKAMWVYEQEAEQKEQEGQDTTSRNE